MKKISSSILASAVVCGLLTPYSAAEEKDLPPKTSTKNPMNAIECGVRVDTNIDRTLEKAGPEITGSFKSGAGDTENERANVTVGLAGSTAIQGANVSDEKLSKLEIGKTEYRDVINIFGKPSFTMRNDAIFFVTYEITKGEVKIDPKVFIPIIGSLIAKPSYNTTKRSVTINFDPESGVLTRCVKQDFNNKSNAESTLETARRINIQ